MLGTKTNGKHCRVGVDLLDNYAMRNMNYPIAKQLAIANFCSYKSSQLSGYYGCCSAMRALITYAFFFEYLLNNNLEDATGIDAAQIFRTELFGDEN